MKIIHITASYKPAYIYGGPIQSVGKLCEALHRLAVNIKSFRQVQNDHFSIEVLTTTANGAKELDVENGKRQIVEGVPVIYFKRWTKDHSHFSPELLLVLRNEILRGTQDNKLILHIHAWWNLVSIFSCWVAKWYKIPVILSPRGMLTSYTIGNRHSIQKRLIHNLLGKRLLKYCHIHATSEQEKADILRIIQPQSISVISNLVGFPKEVAGSEYQVARIENQVASSEDQVSSIKCRESNRKYQDLNHPFRIIFLSRIEEKKGLDLLFEALALLDFSWSLTIAGSGNENYVESLKAKAENLKLNGRIKWLGQVTNEDKFDVMQNSDLLVLTSYNENFANVIIESLSVGTAVLISEHVGLADYIKEKDLGWISALDPIPIAQQITLSYRDINKRAHIREIGPSIISEDYDDEALVKKYINLYNGILNG